MEKRNCEIKTLDIKLCKKRGLQPKIQDVERDLTLEQQLVVLEQELQYWKECKQAVLDKVDEFYPLKTLEDILKETPKEPKEKNMQDIITQNVFDMFKRIEKRFNSRKEEILDQMSPTQRWEWHWNKLQQEKCDWDKIYQEKTKEIANYYKTHKDGGMFYRWLSDDDYYQNQYFKKIEEKLQQQNPELYAKKVAQLKKQQQENEQEK